jgi:hypothetical protein
MYTSPCAEYRCAEDAYDFLGNQYGGLKSQENFNINFAGSWRCLAVQLDVKAERLLHQCRLTGTILIVVR